MLRSVVRVPLVAWLILAGTPTVVLAQTAQQIQAAQQAADQRLREQREELDRVRRERDNLEREAATLRTTAHNLSDEVTNLDRRVEASTRLLRSLDRTLELLNDEVDSASAKMERADHEIIAKRAILTQRVIDVYKRGPMYTVEAMMSARSFGELVARYKYLHELTLRDRSLVARVELLHTEVAAERDRLVNLRTQLTMRQEDRSKEEIRLRALEKEQKANLKNVRAQAQQLSDRIERQNRAIAQMEAIVIALEAAKKKADAAKPAAARVVGSTIKTSDYGKLDWPVNGPLVFPFGKSLTPSNATIHWNGVGIAAPLGTPAHSVGAGRVALVQRLDTYGLTVFIDHGAGDYTIYGSLQKASVKVGQAVAKGEVIGFVGVTDPDLPPHLYFEIRTGGTKAVDPAKWLIKHR